MKKIFAVFIAILFVTSLFLAVVGCKKAEEKAQTTKVAAPASAQKAAPAIKVSPKSKAAPEIKGPAPETANPAKKTKQQQFKSCYDEAKAKALKGDERSKFMTDCIKAIK